MAAKRIKNGTIKHSEEIDFSQDPFSKPGRGSTKQDEGFYVYFTGWKGPYADRAMAAECYREWANEARFS